jgi:hypothetical protein
MILPHHANPSRMEFSERTVISGLLHYSKQLRYSITETTVIDVRGTTPTSPVTAEQFLNVLLRRMDA